MTKRAHIPYPQQLAAALRELGGIPYEHAKLMTADQVISLFHRDHGILHATDPINEHWNLTWTLIAPHREKSKRDTAIVAKSKRIRRKEAVHQTRRLDMQTGTWPMSTDSFADLDRAMGFMTRKRKIASRINPWPKRKLKSNKPRN